MELFRHLVSFTAVMATYLWSDLPPAMGYEPHRFLAVWTLCEKCELMKEFVFIKYLEELKP